jgi:MFS family permease
MSRQQIVALFVCSLVVWTEGNGLLPILPAYARMLHADSTAIGYYLAAAYAALASGTVVAGWISDRFGSRRIPLIAAGTIAIPLLWLMSKAANILELAVLTAPIWFIGGLTLTLTSILTGLFSEEGKHGRIFGLLTGTAALGALIGGLTIGPIADVWGYPALFLVLAVFWAVQPVTGLFLQDMRTVVDKPRGSPISSSPRPALGVPLMLFFVANTLVEVALFIGRLGTSLSMNQLGFGSAAITSTAAVGGFVALPLPLLLGTFSDRIGRRGLLVLCYLAAGSGLLVLAASGALWNFWLAAGLLSVFGYASGGLGSALVMDLASPQSVGKGLSFLNTTIWVGAVIGLVAAGYSFQSLGYASTFIAGSLFPLLGISLLLLTRGSRPQLQNV